MVKLDDPYSIFLVGVECVFAFRHTYRSVLWLWATCNPRSPHSKQDVPHAAAAQRGTPLPTAKLAHITHPLTSTWPSGIVFINFVLEQNHLKYEICLHGNSLTDHDSHRISRFNYPHLYPQWLLISNPVGQLYNLIWAGGTIMHLPAKAIKFWRELAQQLYHTCSLTAKWD